MAAAGPPDCVSLCIIDVNGIRGTTAAFVDQLSRLALGEFQGSPAITEAWQSEVEKFVRDFETCDNTPAGRLCAGQRLCRIWEVAEEISSKQEAFLQEQLLGMELDQKEAKAKAAATKVDFFTMTRGED